MQYYFHNLKALEVLLELTLIFKRYLAYQKVSRDQATNGYYSKYICLSALVHYVSEKHSHKEFRTETKQPFKTCHSHQKHLLFINYYRQAGLSISLALGDWTLIRRRAISLVPWLFLPLIFHSGLCSSWMHHAFYATLHGLFCFALNTVSHKPYIRSCQGQCT